MGSKVNPTVIGMFVIGAIVLAVAGVLLFGGGKFFRKKLPTSFSLTARCRA